MSVLALPTTDVVISGYTTEADSSVGLYKTVAVNSDGHYIQSSLNPSSEAYVCKLSDMGDPQLSTSHTIHFRYAKDSTAGVTINMTLELRQDYVDEGTQGTLIASTSVSDVDSTFVDGSYTLSTSETDAITDYTSLYLRITTTEV